jgi:hypothetical protein
MIPYKTDCGIHSLSSIWLILFPHSAAVSVYQIEWYGLKLEEYKLPDVPFVCA